MECKACGKWFGTILKSDLCPTCERAYNRIFSGVQYERLRELAEADKEGRVVALPCKRGDKVWRICGPKGRKFVAERTVLSVTMYEPGQFEVFTNCFDWLGKTVFLTREEAEAALKEGVRQ